MAQPSVQAKRTLGTSIQDGKIALWFLGEDEGAYGVSLPPLAAIQAVTAILQAAKDLPPNPSLKLEGAIVEGTVGLAVGDKMQPMLAISMNGLELALPLSEAQMTSLRDDMSRFLEGAAH